MKPWPKRSELCPQNTRPAVVDPVRSPPAREIPAAFRSLTKTEVRSRVLREGVRIDGRGLRDIRDLTAEVAVLPRVHGSALFERGETQIMGVTTRALYKLIYRALDSLSAELAAKNIKLHQLFSFVWAL